MAPLTGTVEATSPKLQQRFPDFLRSPAPWAAALRRRDPAPAPPPSYQPSSGTIAPESFNNKGLFALFALLGAAMVLAAIWFFFWAPNGGFRWRKNDWDDYKSTVLRRKGKDGKTLSNATPRTDLGQKSIAGTFDNERQEEMAELGSLGGFSDRPNHREKSPREQRQHKPRTHRRHEPLDDAVRAYRSERPARVGGMNRDHDGSHFDFTNSERSETYSDVISNNSRTHLNPRAAAPDAAAAPPKKKGFLERRAAKRDRKRTDKAARQHAGTTPTSTPAKPSGAVRHRLEQRRGLDDDSTVADHSEHHGSNGTRQTSESYYANMYRPQAGTGAGRAATSTQRRTEDRRRSGQPNAGRQAAGFRRQDPKPPGSFDAYSEAGSSDTGTKMYSHHIPALSRGSRDVGGFRRGGASGRRDSLSDSD